MFSGGSDPGGGGVERRFEDGASRDPGKRDFGPELGSQGCVDRYSVSSVGAGAGASRILALERD